MHSSIRIAIVLTLSLIWITQLSFSPVLLSVIFAICIGCLWYFMKSTGNHFPKWAIYILTLVALAVTFWSYQSFLGVEAGVAVLSIFLFAKALETKTQRDVIILFNFALFVAASMFLHSQSFMTAVMVLLCLLSCLLGLYRVQTHAFASENSNRMALRQDAKHVIKFVGLALPFFVLLFIFFPRLPPLWHIPIPKLLSLPNPLFKLLSRKMLAIDPLARSSMQDDLIAGRPTEVDWINGEVLKLAEQSGRQAPINARLIALIKQSEKSSPSFSMSADALKDQLKSAAKQ